MTYPKSDYKEYPKSLDPNDLWGQVRRTINGKPVPEAQIALIVEAVRDRLRLNSNDVVLDLACGNGALSRYFFDDCRALHGVDWSAYLIKIAQERFCIADKSTFQVDDAVHYVQSEPEPLRFTKVLCYGSFSYFPEPDALQLLRELSRRFTNVTRIMLGNLPDLDRAENFYRDRRNYVAELKDSNAQIGIWRSQSELRSLISAAGWDMEFVNMPEAFYAAHYRFDAILSR